MTPHLLGHFRRLRWACFFTAFLWWRLNWPIIPPFRPRRMIRARNRRRWRRSGRFRRPHRPQQVRNHLGDDFTQWFGNRKVGSRSGGRRRPCFGHGKGWRGFRRRDAPAWTRRTGGEWSRGRQRANGRKRRRFRLTRPRLALEFALGGFGALLRNRLHRLADERRHHHDDDHRDLHPVAEVRELCERCHHHVNHKSSIRGALAPISGHQIQISPARIAPSPRCRLEPRGRLAPPPDPNAQGSSKASQFIPSALHARRRRGQSTPSCSCPPARCACGSNP